MKPIRRPENVWIQVGGAFPVNVWRVIRRALRRARGAWPRNQTISRDFEADDTGGVLGDLLADEDELDRRALWRLGSWGVGATAAVILAVMANQSSLGLKRDRSPPPIWPGRRSKSRWLPRKPRTKRGGSPPPSIRSMAIATGCIPASPAWNRGSTPSPGPSPGRVPRRLQPVATSGTAAAAKSAALAARRAGSNRPGHGARCRQIHCRRSGARPGCGLLRRQGCREDRRSQSGERQAGSGKGGDVKSGPGESGLGKGADRPKPDLAKSDLAKSRRQNLRPPRR